MDAAPTYEFWSRFAAILAAEVAAMAAIAWGLEKLNSSGAWRRSIWHVCLIGLVTLVVVEASGLSQIVAAQLAQRPNAMESTSQHSQFQPVLTAEIIATGTYEATTAFTPLPEPSPAENTRESWWPAILWLAGFGIVSAWAVFVRALFAFVSRRRCALAEEHVVNRCRQVAARLGMRDRFELIEIAGIRAPVAFGIISRKVGVPQDFETFTPPQQEVMLAHELAHVAGRDAAWYFLADLLVALLWWHPVAWWVRRRLHLATEAAADETCLLVKDGPNVLAQTLIALGATLLKPQHRGALGIKGLRSGLASRVQRLMALNGDKWSGPSFARYWALKLCGPVLLAAGTIAGFAWTGNSRGTPHEEWRNSIAARAYAALSAAAAEADIERIPGLLGDAKIFFDAGKFDHAEGLCEEVLKTDPQNGDALRLLEEISKARKAGQGEKLAEPSRSQPHEMERILPKNTTGSNDRFVAPQTMGSFEHVISNALAVASEKRMRKAGLMPRERSTDTTNVVYNSKGRQRIRRLLEEIRLPSVMFDNVRLAEVLSRLSAEIKERDPEKRGFDLLISSEVPSAPIDPATGLPVATRFLIGPGESLLRVENRNIRIDPPLQNLTLGLALDAICKVAEPPVCYSVEDYAVVFLPTDRPRPLYTRTYKVDMKALAAHFNRRRPSHPLNELPPMRASEASGKFRDVQEFFSEAGVDLAPPKAIFWNDLGMLMVRTTLEDQDLIQKALSKFTAPARQVLLEVKVAEFRGDAVGITSALGIELNDKKILVDPQYRMLVRALEQRDHVDVLGPQRVVTLSGHQSRFQLPTVETLGLDEAVMRVMTRVGPDDRTISLDVLVGEREAAKAVLRDRQTLMLHLPAVKKVYANGVSVRVFVRIALVTVTVLDTDGNRLHAEEHEMPSNPFEGIWILPGTRSP